MISTGQDGEEPVKQLQMNVFVFQVIYVGKNTIYQQSFACRAEVITV